MNLSLRFIIPLVLVLGLMTLVVRPLVDSLTQKWFVRDLDIRSQLVANTLNDAVAELVQSGNHRRVEALFDRVTKDERLYALAFCADGVDLKFATPLYPADLACEGSRFSDSKSVLMTHHGQVIHAARYPLESAGRVLGQLMVVHDMSFVERRSEASKTYLSYLFIALGAVISFVTVVIAQLSWRGWVEGMRALLRGEGLVRPLQKMPRAEFLPLAKDLRALVRELESDRRARDESQFSWTPKTLKAILQEELSGDEILIVSNREPYIHNRKGDKIEVQVPASGLVTALEPVMRACSGTWIAHGSGSADRDVVDQGDRVHVPPEDPSYFIRRVWLTPEEEKGYYYGFSNEGLWPLCHIAHTRPTFRSEDWEKYVQVNQKFANVVCEEAKTEDPVVLVQDYHFALLPRLIREKLPRATIITFWHIPWPNPEAFGVCPWREEILDGLLGSSILGFHTRFHCNNFVDTVDRFLEARIDRETSTISFGQKFTAIRNYPISIEWPVRWLGGQETVRDCRMNIRSLYGFSPSHRVGIGVDRLDYTKGILERFLAVERLLELYPEWIGVFTFIQIAAPSRSVIDQYQEFERQVLQLADRINTRFGSDGYRPILLKVEHHGPEAVFHHYRASDVCLVTSLHDGMNLVAKEFISARDDNQGVLILSQFAGAAKELPEALIVNPYNIDQCAQALHLALTMPSIEQKDRMRSMRGFIREYNVYRWAGRMLMDAARMRQRQRMMGRIHELGATKESGAR